MRYRRLGKSDIKVSEIGFGAWSIGLDWWGKKIEDDEAIRMLKRAYDVGINFYDTADIYGKGKSEKLIGIAFKGMRDEIVYSTKWGYDIGTGGNGWGNNELEYYTNRPENVSVHNGVLKITAIKEKYDGSAYTSARILSKNKFEFTYGKVEVKAKLPAGIGTWPAIWMLGSNNNTAGWPACGEIDIMEHRGNELNKIFGTLHYPERSGGNADGNTTLITGATTEFHIYTLDWTASSIKIFVDNQLYHIVVNSASVPFNHNFFLIMNLAIGGNFAGNVDPSFTKESLEVDYIRVYK